VKTLSQEKNRKIGLLKTYTKIKVGRISKDTVPGYKWY
jgi:hypothetical protein